MLFWWRNLSRRRLLDGLLLVLLLVIAFLLGCYEMGDSDIWWHLRGGQWILEQGGVPRRDPFTFGSADKLWVDVHWSYEVILALAHRAGGIGALVLLGATVGAMAFLTVLTARHRSWPAAATVLCWIPSLMLLSFRLDPRPEIFSLLYLGCYLAILWRADERPSLLWLLVIVQVLWTNVQGLFILGPILLGMFVAARGARLLWLLCRGEGIWTTEEKRRWKHIGGVSLAVAAACLVNPYFLKGVWFPFELFPKVADPNNPYKKYIDELQSPADQVREATLRVLGKNLFFRSLYFLLPLLPLSFLYPSAWRSWRAPQPQGKPSRRGGKPPCSPSTGAWLGGLAAILVLLILSTFTLSGEGPVWLNALGQNVPLLLLASGAMAAFAMHNRSPSAATVLGVGAAALAACMVWLDVTILGSGRGLFTSVTDPRQAMAPLLITGVLAGALVLRWGGDLFPILLAGAFAFLALQALQNWTRYALVAGTVLSWNFAKWAEQLQTEEQPRPWWLAAGWSLRMVLLLALGVWIAALASDRFYIHTGLPRHFAFREEPLSFAHEAAIFAGQPGLPDRALVYGLDQTGVYDFHNAPRCKPFMDGRLEMPDLQTFNTYVAIQNWLETHDPRWEKAVADLGNPLVLIGHEGVSGQAEPPLFAHPSWRCVYFDALAAVFVPRQRVSPIDFPPVDFAARHFQEPDRPSVPNVPRAAAREERALYKLAAFLALRSPPGPSESFWRGRLPLLLSALDRAQLALQEDANQADVWIVLGNCHRELDPGSSRTPPALAEAWQVERDLARARATYCFHRALQSQPENGAAWRFLAMTYSQRGMIEAELAASKEWLRFDPKVQRKQREQDQANRRRFTAQSSSVSPSEPLPSAFSRLVREGRPLTAIQRFEASGQSSWSWSFAEQVASLYLHLGRPVDARRIWQQAPDCPSEAILACRLACTFWVERDFEAALSHYRKAQQADPQLGEACWGLAQLQTQLGDARAAFVACQHGLRLTLTSRQRSELEALQQLVAPYKGVVQE
ncbi:MAG TPA: hypothetical protein VMG10_16260 [Gemmataceae bacterium]|nr:hypothetical protein [Gemmataceae bacterium]